MDEFDYNWLLDEPRFHDHGSALGARYTDMLYRFFAKTSRYPLTDETAQAAFNAKQLDAGTD